MIVIHTFSEAHQLYLQGKLPFRLLQDQALLLLDIAPQPNRHIFDAVDIADSDIEWLLEASDIAGEDYNGMLGGDFHVCEVEADLKQITGMDMAFAKEHGNRWPDVTELVMSWDQCRYLDEEWAMFLLCSNNAGGDSFYVPKALWQAAQMAEHIAATELFWNAQK